MYLNILLGIPGVGQVVIIIVALLLLFGGKKIPELMKGLGQGMKEFKNATKEDLSGNANPQKEINSKSESE